MKYVKTYESISNSDIDKKIEDAIKKISNNYV